MRAFHDVQFRCLSNWMMLMNAKRLFCEDDFMRLWLIGLAEDEDHESV